MSRRVNGDKWFSNMWVVVSKKQLKNPNATVCAEGELEKQGTQAKKQLKTPTVTACYNRRSVNKVVRIPISSRFPKKEKSVDSLDPEEVREHANT